MTAIASARDDYNLINPHCDVCHGTGTFRQSRDPSHHVDWWVVGGRYAGLFAAHGIAAGDVAPVREIIGKLVPAAIVSPEGDWHEGPGIIASGLRFLEEEERPTSVKESCMQWERIVAEVLPRYEHCLAVVVDCHS